MVSASPHGQPPARPGWCPARAGNDRYFPGAPRVQLEVPCPLCRPPKLRAVSRLAGLAAGAGAGGLGRRPGPGAESRSVQPVGLAMVLAGLAVGPGYGKRAVPDTRVRR